MNRFALGGCLAALCLAAPAWADAEKPAAKPLQVPYRLTATKHILVRARINRKGPFNFILDTGAPTLFVAKKVGKKLGIDNDESGWATFRRFEIEGGVSLKDLKGRIETPFQVEGMNGLGLLGVELHGMIGYSVLARYKMEIDFNRDKMTWTPLAFEPRLPRRLNAGAPPGEMGGLDFIGSIMKALGSGLGMDEQPEVRRRGFAGMALKDGPEYPEVASVLEKGPAARAGLKTGDRILKVQGRTVVDTDDVLRLTRKLPAGAEVRLSVQRGSDSEEIAFRLREGL
jgi:hypothetical protein